MHKIKIVIPLALLLTSNSWSMREGSFLGKIVSSAIAVGRSLHPGLAADPLAKMRPEQQVARFLVAAQEGKLELVQVLLPHINDVNVQEETQHVSALTVASQNGHLHVVKFLLEQKDIDCNIRASLGHTPLRQASQSGHLAVVKALVEAKANVKERTNNGDTALTAASEQGRVEVVDFLLQNGARDTINWPDNKGDTPLHAASSHNQIPVVKILLEARAQPLVYNKADSLPIHVASFFGYGEIVDMLLRAAPGSVNSHGPNGATCLHLASQERHFYIVEALVTAKADVEALDDIHHSALIAACQAGNYYIAELLLKHGAQKTIHVRGKQGASCLRQAAQGGNPWVIDLLLENGAQVDINGRDTKGITPLYVASSLGHSDCVDRLITAKADVTITTDKGFLPLHAACENGNLTTVRMLVDAAPHTIDASPDGIMTPLHFALVQKKVEVAPLLLESKASPEFRYLAHNGALQTVYVEIRDAEWVISWPTSIKEGEKVEEGESPAESENSEKAGEAQESGAHTDGLGDGGMGENSGAGKNNIEERKEN